ncbi:MAG: hypothetical protein WCO57_12305 [Verrucomicrobiota bacterium]
MTRSVQLLALWLAALWLPLTLHCQWAGMQTCCVDQACCEGQACGDDHSCCGETSGCHSVVCKLIENGNYFLKKAPLMVPVASADGCAALEPIAQRHSLPPVATLSPATGAPPGWHRVWQFVFRAAASPRAPAAVC